MASGTIGGSARWAARRITVLAAIALAAAIALPALVPAAADAAPAAVGAELDMRLERSGPIVRHDYSSLPRIARDGATGANLDRARVFSLAHQRLGDLWIRAGLVHDKPRLIERGFKAFDYAFRRQEGGDWGPRQVEEYAFFVEAVAHSGLLLRDSRYRKRYREQLRFYAKRLRRGTSYMIAEEPFADFEYRNRWYTHSGYLMGTALTLATAFTGREELEPHGRSAIRLALSRQMSDGVNPELNGYDVRYQMTGITYAERFLVYFPDGRLARRVERMTDSGIQWMQGRVGQDGYIDWAGSTRTCSEENTRGSLKTPGYSNAVRGFAYWGRLQRQRELTRAAWVMNRYSRRHAGELCEDRQEPAPAEPGDGGDGSGDDLLPRARVNDLLE